MFRMNRSIFNKLHETLVKNYGLKSTRVMSSFEWHIPLVDSSGGDFNGTSSDDGDMCALRDFIANSLMAGRE